MNEALSKSSSGEPAQSQEVARRVVIDADTFARFEFPEVLYYWGEVEDIALTLHEGLIPGPVLSGANHGKSVVFLQDTDDEDFAFIYRTPPRTPVCFAVDTKALSGEWSADKSVWNEWYGEDEQGMEGDSDHPTAGDSLHYTGCICYHGVVPPEAISIVPQLLTTGRFLG